MHLPYIVGQPAPYPEDSGPDILMKLNSPVIAIADGQVEYCEGWGASQRHHTPWVKTADHPDDTPGALLLRLAQPLKSRIGIIRYAWYCHLSLGFAVIRWRIDPRRFVKEGMMIGHSGIGRSIPHLHFGLLTDPAQLPGQFLPPFEVIPFLQLHGAK